MLRPDVQSTTHDGDVAPLPLVNDNNNNNNTDNSTNNTTTTAATSRVVWCESWLEKKAEWRVAWDRRLVVLDGRRIAYRVAATAPEKKHGTVRALRPAVASTRPYTFALAVVEGDGTANTWTLRAPDHATYAQWLDAITRALATNDDNNKGDKAVAPLPSLAHGTMPALQPTPSSSSASVVTPLLVTAVRKQSAWTGVWHARVLELYADLVLVNRATATSAVRSRYIILAIDAAPPTVSATAATATAAATTTTPTTLFGATHVLVSTTSGERFWLQFANVDEAAHWCRIVDAELRRHRCWQWTLLPGTTRLHHTVAAMVGVGSSSSSSSSSGGGGGTSVLRSDGSAHAYALLRMHYHAAAYAPHYTVPGAMALYVYGGSQAWCALEFCATARAFVPQPQPAHVLRSLRVLELAGAHAVHTMNIDAHEVAPGVRVRPPALCGATLTALSPLCAASHDDDKDDNDNDTTKRVCSRADAPLLLLLGGLTGLSGGASRTEVWTASTPPHATSVPMMADTMTNNSNDSSSSATGAMRAPCWERHTLPTYELPQLAFHDAIALSVCDAALTPPPPSTSTTTSSPRCGVLVTGGLDKDGRARAECYLVTWWSHDTARAATATSTTTTLTDVRGARMAQQQPQPQQSPPPRLRVRAFGFLPEPRAFHRTALLRDGTVVLVGGRGMENAAVAHTVLTLASASSCHAARAHEHDNDNDNKSDVGTTTTTTTEWQPARYDAAHAPLPPLPDVAIAVTPCGTRVVALAQHSTPRHVLRLYMLDFDVCSTSSRSTSNASAREQPCVATPPASSSSLLLRWHEVRVGVGSAPRRAIGCSLHIHGGYVYVLGGGESAGRRSSGGGDDDTTLRVELPTTPQHLCKPMRLLADAL